MENKDKNKQDYLDEAYDRMKDDEAETKREAEYTEAEIDEIAAARALIKIDDSETIIED